MSLAKYNARDLAKDFGMQAKAIAGILNEYTGETPSPTKILTDRVSTTFLAGMREVGWVTVWVCLAAGACCWPLWLP